MAEAGTGAQETSARMRGVVKWFNNAKGYGFIEPATTPEGMQAVDLDHYVHYTEIEDNSNGFRSLHEGQDVTFTPVRTEKGMQARAVRPA